MSALDEIEAHPSRKSLPMIVDISISNDGRQIYQVHETSNPLREEMPISKFEANKENNGNSVGSPSVKASDNDEAQSSVSSFASSNNKRSFDDMALNATQLSENDDEMVNKMIKLSSSFSASSSESSYQMSNRSRMEEESEVWGPDVEKAFEEALRIIPKNGLSKIKVSGRSCGRNELISDYILQETGKLRTRKQVSSHIQVIKNLKKNDDLIDLINNGPSDPNSLKKFEEVFSKITFQKSIGDNQLVTGGATAHLLNINKKPNRRRVSHYMKNICEVGLKGFQMNCSNRSLSSLKSKEFDTTLKLKNNVNISARFPGLFDLVLNNAIPSLHGMCKVHLPSELDKDEKNLESYNTHLDLELKGLSVNESSWSVLTVIYSFGQEVVRLTDLAEVKSQEINNGVKNADLKIKFAPEFWDAFFTSLGKTKTADVDDKHKDVAIRAITIKQIIFKNNYGADEAAAAASGPANILKKDIRSIVLWEFLRVHEPVKAQTTIRRIHLINPMMTTAAAGVPANVGLAAPAPVPAMNHDPMMPLMNSVNYVHHQPQPQHQQPYPYTPSATASPNRNMQAMQTPSYNLVNLQQQEDLINRLESPINMMNQQAAPQHQRQQQYHNGSPVSNEFQQQGYNNGSMNGNFSTTTQNYQFHSPNFVTFSNSMAAAGQFEYPGNFGTSGASMNSMNTINNRSFNESSNGNADHHLSVNGPIPKKMYSESSNLLQQFEAGVASNFNFNFNDDNSTSNTIADGAINNGNNNSNNNGQNFHQSSFEAAVEVSAAQDGSINESRVSFNSDFSLNSAASNSSSGTSICPTEQTNNVNKSNSNNNYIAAADENGNIIGMGVGVANYNDFGLDAFTNSKPSFKTENFAEELIW